MQQQAFRICVHSCQSYLTGGDTHVLCAACLGEEHAQSAIESATPTQTEAVQQADM